MTGRPTADLIQIVANGGSLDLDATFYPVQELIQIVRNMHSKATVRLRTIAQRPTADLVQISANAVGEVSFVFD